VATRRITPFKPFTPYGTPPPDRYDPALDATVAAGERGYGDLVTNAATANRRGIEDYGFGVADANRTQDRGLADIGTQRGYATEDHNRAIQMLTRNYQQLGNRQGEQARVMGVSSGGALLQAARKRQENQTLDQQPIDTSFNRTISGLQTGENRLREDTSTGIARLGVNTQRGIEDTGLQVQRGGREQVFLGTDTATAKSAQAAATGWDPGAKPKNEFTGAGGTHRVIVRGNTAYVVDPSGKVLSTRPARSR
jgi:hypothetical protein